MHAMHMRCRSGSKGCLLAWLQTRASRRADGRSSLCRAGYTSACCFGIHRINGPGGAGHPCQARSIGPVHANAPRTTKQAAPCACRALAATGCSMPCGARACRRGPSLSGCWLCLACRRARLSIRLSNSAYNGLP